LNLKSSIETARCDGRKTLKSVSQVNSGVDRKDPNNYRRNPRIIEEIITALFRIRWIFVIARNSSFTYKGQPVDVKRYGSDGLLSDPAHEAPALGNTWSKQPSNG